MISLLSSLLFYFPSLCSSLDPLSSSLTYSYQVSCSQTRPVCPIVILLFIISSQVRRTLVQLNDSYDMQLSQEQDNELHQFITAIQERGQDELESVFKEADEAGGGVGDELCHMWERDVA